MKQCRGQMSMFSAEASLDPASRLVLPGSEEARRMTVTSGLKCLELYRNSGPLGSLVRTLLESSIWRSTRCTLTWKIKDTPSRRLLFRLAPLTRRTGGTEYVSWAGNDQRAIYFIPTPRAQNIKTSEKAKRERKSSPGLVDYIQMFPTPKAQNCRGDGKPHGNGGPSLDVVAGGALNPDWVEWLMGFPVGWTEV